MDNQNTTIRPVYVMSGLDHYDNPHSCIYPDQCLSGGEHNEPCLACLLIEVLGEERRGEALNIAYQIGTKLMNEREASTEAVQSRLAL